MFVMATRNAGLRARQTSLWRLYSNIMDLYVYSIASRDPRDSTLISSLKECLRRDGIDAVSPLPQRKVLMQEDMENALLDQFISAFEVRRCYCAMWSITFILSAHARVLPPQVQAAPQDPARKETQ